jgi:hypothetical protein
MNTTRKSTRLLTIALLGGALLAPASAMAGPGNGNGKGKNGGDRGRNGQAQGAAHKGDRGAQRGQHGAQQEGHGTSRQMGPIKCLRNAPSPPQCGSLIRTHIVLKVARAAVKRGGAGRDRLKVAALHQRAAGIALKRGAPRVALFLTREARERARAVIALNRGREPASAADLAGEFDGASQAGAGQFLNAARKMGPSKKVQNTVGRSQGLLGHAARAARKNGKGKQAVRRAAVYQRAAITARRRGDERVALDLTARSRNSAREALTVNGAAAPADTADVAGEFEGATAEGGDEYVAAAEQSVPAEVDEQVVATLDEPASESPEAPEEAVDFAAYDYEVDEE